MAAFSLWRRPERPQKKAENLIQYRHVAYDLIDSTNLRVKSAIDAGQAEGLVVRATSQTAGYGRQGRTWASPQGGLYLSVLLRPTVRLDVLPSLSLVAAVAVCRALRRLLPANSLADIRIKWPNDIILVPEACVEGDEGEGAVRVRDGQMPLPVPPPTPVSAPGRVPLPIPPAFLAPRRIEKLCGISLEAYRGAVCLGVGLNVIRPDETANVEGKNTPVYMADLGFQGSVDDAADVVLDELACAYDRWQERGLAPFVREFEEFLAYRGEVVEIRDIAGKVYARGVLQGIDDEGRLLIEQDGEQSCISSGELHPAM